MLWYVRPSPLVIARLAESGNATQAGAAATDTSVAPAKTGETVRYKTCVKVMLLILNCGLAVMMSYTGALGVGKLLILISYMNLIGLD